MQFTIPELRQAMAFPDEIRNFSVIAHVDHGKTTLTDSLIARAGIIKKADAGEKCSMDTRQDEQDRGITIKSTGVTLYYEYKQLVGRKTVDKATGNALKGKNLKQKNSYLINLIDSPGHVDFSSEVTAALRVTDGALVVVCCVEGASVQTETVLGQALREMIKPVLFVNKMDRYLRELQYDAETMYEKARAVIDKVNVVIGQNSGGELMKEMCDKGNLDDLLVDPAKGTVAFGSGYEQWGFTLTTFAERMVRSTWTGEGSGNEADLMEDLKLKSIIDMRQMLWGDWFYAKKKDKETGKTTRRFTNEAFKKTNKKGKRGKKRERTFCKFVLEPIIKLCKICMEGTLEQIQETLDLYKIPLNTKVDFKDKKSQQIMPGRKLNKIVFQKWINASDAILEMVVNSLPSPRKAQKYRVKYLYEGPKNDEMAKAISACDPKGRLCMFVSKMFPTKDFSRFRAFGRVFSGTVDQSQHNGKIRIQSQGYKPRIKVSAKEGGEENKEGKEAQTQVGSRGGVLEKGTFHVVKFQKTILMMGGKEEPISSVPCGNTCAIIGVDNYIKKQATIVNADDEYSYNIRMMKYTVSPVVRVSVSCKNAQDLPKLVDGLRKLSKSDPLVVVSQDKATKEHIIAGCGDLHIEICMKDLRELYTKNCEVVQGEPVVSYQETITAPCSQTCLAKSPNKQNRIWMEARPLDTVGTFKEKTVKGAKKIVEDANDKSVKTGEQREEDWQKEQVGKLGLWIEDGRIGPGCDELTEKEQIKLFVNEFGWDKNQATRIWDYGAQSESASLRTVSGYTSNMILDDTKGVQYLQDIKDSVTTAFQEVTQGGVLAEETLSNACFFIKDVKLHADSIHRGAGQIIPPTKRTMKAAQIKSETRFLEPMFKVQILCPSSKMKGVYNLLNSTRGEIIEQSDAEGNGDQQKLDAYLPVAESFGFTEKIRAATQGKAFPTMQFDKWEQFGNDPFDESSAAYKLVLKIRTRKGRNAVLPKFEKFYDKL